MVFWSVLPTSMGRYRKSFPRLCNYVFYIARIIWNLRDTRVKDVYMTRWYAIIIDHTWQIRFTGLWEIVANAPKFAVTKATTPTTTILWMGPIVTCSDDNLRPLTKTPSDNQFVLVIKDLHKKLTTRSFQEQSSSLRWQLDIFRHYS